MFALGDEIVSVTVDYSVFQVFCGESGGTWTFQNSEMLIYFKKDEDDRIIRYNRAMGIL